MIDKYSIEQARKTDVIAFLEKHCDFTFTESGGTSRSHQHKSLAVKNDHLSWYWHSKGIGGHGALDYLIKIENMAFSDAVEVVLRLSSSKTAIEPQQTLQHSNQLILPEKAGIPLRLYDYLCNQRGIDGEIVNKLIQEKKLFEDKRGNVVFVGYDEQNRPRFASLRGTYGDQQFRMDCSGSDKRYSFNMLCPQSEQLYIYESPIDAMSHASLEKNSTGDTNAWEQCSRLSLAGTSDTALLFFLNKHSFVKDLVFCLDNDVAGREASKNMINKYCVKGFETSIMLPIGKDWNEDLTAKQNEVKRTVRQKGLSI